MTTDKCYLKFTITPTGYLVKPADTKTFERAQGVGERLESSLVPMPNDVTLTSLAISMARLAESVETLERVAYHTYVKQRRPSLWARLTKKTEKDDAPSE